MLQGYNLAFMPMHNSKKFIKLAHETALHIKPGHYLLGPTSLPHVSICHFITEDTEVENIWKEVRALSLPSLSLTFSTQRVKIYPTDAYSEIRQCSVSLIPNKKDILMKIHLQIANIVKKPLNSSFSKYDPHLTLLNSYDIEGYNNVNPTLDLSSPIEDTFTIALGTIDRIGQVTGIIY